MDLFPEFIPPSPIVDNPRSKTRKQEESYTEEETMKILGVSRQTLRNRRVGYTDNAGFHPPTLEKGVHWFKLRDNRRGPVRYSKKWVDEVAEAKALASIV
jgi:hypothetical protein